MTKVTKKTKCGFVGVLGAPNAGKSTLVNRLVGAKVSIVTPKVQTTRTSIRGIAIQDETQVVFVDTPGIFQPKRRLDRAMVNAAWGGAGDADLNLLLVDAHKGICKDTQIILDNFSKLNSEKVLVLNKIDTVQKEKLLDLSLELNQKADFAKTFMISAENGSGVKDLFNYVCSKMPESVWLFDADQVSDMPVRLLAAEITREKLFLRLRQELPYFLTVETEKWEERKDGSVKIDQNIYVERDSQKSIVLGEGGQMIKAIGQSARRELEKVLGQKVHLFLFVKVRENWSEDKNRFEPWGLDFNA